jgi:hypothetical protein
MSASLLSPSEFSQASDQWAQDVCPICCRYSKSHKDCVCEGLTQQDGILCRANEDSVRSLEWKPLDWTQFSSGLDAVSAEISSISGLRSETLTTLPGVSILHLSNGLRPRHGNSSIEGGDGMSMWIKLN